MIKLIRVFLFWFLFISFDYSAFISFDKVDTFYLKYTNIYKSCDDSIYFSYKNTLYSIKNKVFKEVFFSETGIHGIAGGKGVIVIFNSSDLIVIDSFTNKLLWEKKMKGFIMSEPVIGDSFLYIDKNSSIILAFDLYTGQLVWKFDVPINDYLTHHGSKILLSKDYLVYIIADVKIVVLYKNNGRKVKSFGFVGDNFSLNCDFEINKILLYNDILYVHYTNGDFIVFDIVKGKLCYKLENIFVLDFFVYKNKLFIINKYFELKIFDKFTLEQLYSKRILFFDKYLFSKVLYKRGLLVIYGNQGEILFFNLDDMKCIFSLKTPFKIIDLHFNNSEDLAYIFSTEFKVSVFKFFEKFEGLDDYEKNNDYR